MNKDINLVSTKDSGELKHKKKIKYARIVAIISLLSVSFLAAFLFILSNQISLAQIKKDQSSVLQGISSLRTKAAKLSLLNDRLTDVQGILKERKDYTLQINSILGQIPPETTVRVLEIDDENGFSVSVESPSLVSLNDFINKITEVANKQSTIKRLRVDNLIFNEKAGIYTTTLKADLI